MIDTVRFTIQDFEIDQNKLRQRASTQRLAYGTRLTNFARLPDDGFTLSTFEYNRHGTRSRGVTLELSVPKFLFGSNLFEVSDEHLLPFTERLASKLIELGIRTSPECLADGRLSRLDFCRNVPFMGDPVLYMNSLAKVSNGYRASTDTVRIKNGDNIDGHQLIVSNQCRRSTIYDKMTQASLSDASREALDEFKAQYPDYELIRIEHSLLNRLAVKRTMAAYRLSATLKNAWSANLSAEILSGIYSEVFNHGVLPDQIVVSRSNSRLGLEMEALKNRVKIYGLEKTLNDLKFSNKPGRYYKLRASLAKLARDSPRRLLDPNQIENYLRNFKPILNPPICVPSTAHSIS